MTFADDFEEFEAFHGDSFSAIAGRDTPVLCHRISQLQMYVRLCITMERIHARINKMRDLGVTNTSNSPDDVTGLWQDLQQWRASVPAHLSAFLDHEDATQPPLPNTMAIL